MLEDLDLASFWSQSDYADEAYVLPPATDLEVRRIESTLGYELPASYVELCRHQNGGVPTNTSHRTGTPTSWAPDHVVVTGIFGIGDAKQCSLGGTMGSRFWIEAWGYPPIGVYFADCPSAGHDMLCLDDRGCGPSGEPTVVHVDQECDYEVTLVAVTFEAFIRGLESDETSPFEG